MTDRTPSQGSPTKGTDDAFLRSGYPVVRISQLPGDLASCRNVHVTANGVTETTGGHRSPDQITSRRPAGIPREIVLEPPTTPWCD